ncbi:LPXTG-site transpeptidase (sortase) family protein [Propionicimonas paludicola]|uniref:LPXTG-site transpeptidase (Sortase) family protein n=1 Tax=Propionicimonas paludicola TaxID=185243 RepID=A0A2A9CTE9_9ACTN|nr:sortase [Propionicimonas paludicola]PFG17648.1 LPXTG-site transpeptidase (sortase) family protein [Propionicimonas paludicola]
MTQQFAPVAAPGAVLEAPRPAPEDQARRSTGQHAPGSPDRFRRPPKRLPRQLPQYAPLSRTQLLVRASLGLVAALLAAFLIDLVGFSHLQHLISQQQSRDLFVTQLADGTAPVNEGDVDGVLLADGAPVARLQIPALGINEIIGEGTTSSVLAKGPGHRRDTPLPGQGGVSVIMGRASAFGGPFGRLQELPPGEAISVVTGQGEQLFRVIGVRYAGDPAPGPVASGRSRMVLETARGGPYFPQGVVRVDAELVSATQANGGRMTTPASLPASARELAGDFSTSWALVFALQFLIVAEVAAVYAYRRFGWARTWVVFVPVLALGSLLVADQVIRLLPNLL